MKDIKETIQFITLSNHSGQRIDKLLSLIYPEYSRSYVKKLILQGALFIDSVNVKDVSIKVQKNQIIKLVIPKAVKVKNKAENILTMHPAVYDVAVIGVPNDEFGEEVKAVVQLVDPKKAEPALERELIAYCRSHLADLKCPRSIDFKEELPRHPTGKLYKRLLKDQYWSDKETRI